MLINRKKQLYQNQGFTLLEILIAITILLFLSISINKVVHRSSIEQEKIMLEDRELLDLENAIQRMKIDITNLYTPLFYSSQFVQTEEKNENTTSEDSKSKFVPSETFPQVTKSGVPIPLIQNENKSSLSFFTSSNRRKFENAKQSHYAWVSYELRSSAKKKNLYELVRKYSPSNPFVKEFNWDEIKTHILFDGIKSMTFEFWNNKKEEWVEGLKELSNQLIFRLIRLKIIWIDTLNSENVREQSFRVQWPYFDTKKDDEEVKKALTPKKDNNEK